MQHVVRVQHGQFIQVALLVVRIVLVAFVVAAPMAATVAMANVERHGLCRTSQLHVTHAATAEL